MSILQSAGCWFKRHHTKQSTEDNRLELNDCSLVTENLYTDFPTLLVHVRHERCLTPQLTTRHTGAVNEQPLHTA